jgi:hypothetical protein
MTSSVISQPISAIIKFNVITKICKYKDIRGITLFQWPWRCTMHPNEICIVSSRNVLVFFTIDIQEVIYSCLFAFNFSRSKLVLLFNML